MVAGHSAGELMPKMCLSYCLMHAEYLTLCNSFWKESVLQPAWEKGEWPFGRPD